MTRLAIAILGLVIVSLSVSRGAHAQVNIEVLADQAGKDGWVLLLGQSLTYRQGNVDSLATANQVSAFYSTYEESQRERLSAWLRQRILLNAQYRRTGWNGETFVNSAFTHVRWTSMWTRRLGTELFGQYEFNELILLERRMLVGAGVRVDLLNSASVHVYGGSGYMVEDEERNIPEDFDDPVFMTNHRSTSYIAVRAALDDRLSFVSTTYVQPRLDDFADVQVLSDTTFLFDITRNLSFSTSFVTDHDSRSPADTANTDVRLTQGMNFDWSFSRRERQTEESDE